MNNGPSRRLRINGPRCGLSEWHNRVARIEDAAKAFCNTKCARGCLRITSHKAMVPVFLPRAGRGQDGRASLRVSMVLQVHQGASSFLGTFGMLHYVVYRAHELTRRRKHVHTVMHLRPASTYTARTTTRYMRLTARRTRCTRRICASSQSYSSTPNPSSMT